METSRLPKFHDLSLLGDRPLCSLLRGHRRPHRLHHHHLPQLHLPPLLLHVLRRQRQDKEDVRVCEGLLLAHGDHWDLRHGPLLLQGGFKISIKTDFAIHRQLTLW